MTSFGTQQEMEHRVAISIGGRGCVKWTEDELCEHLRLCEEEFGRSSLIAYERYKKVHPEAPANRTFRIRFGSWNDAKVAAGLTPTEGLRKFGSGRITHETCCQALRLVGAAAKRQPTVQEYMDYKASHPEVKLPSPAYVRQLFGGWPEALAAAFD